MIKCNKKSCRVSPLQEMNGDENQVEVLNDQDNKTVEEEFLWKKHVQ